MSRIIITNDETMFNSLIDENIKSGVELCERKVCSGLYFASFYKRVNKNENYFENKESDFAMCSGTFLYRESTGVKGLENILLNYDNNLDIRNEIIGNYSFILAKDNEITVFCDPYAIYDLFYFEENGKFAVCNSLKELATIKSDKSVKVSSLISETILSGYIGNETFIKGVYKLRGTEKLVLNPDTLFVDNVNYNKKTWDFSQKTIEQAVEEYVDLVRKYTSQITKVWGDIGVHQTGGLDNRLIFSALMNSNVEPLLLYGRGNSILTTTNQEDYDCVLEYTKKFKIKNHIMNWGHKESDYSSNSIDNLYGKYGFKFAIYGASQSFFDEYEGGIPDYPEFLEFGYFGENLRLREYLGDRLSVPLDEFFDVYLFGGRYGDINDLNFLPDAEEVKQTLREEYLKEASLFGIYPGDEILAEDFDEFRWVHARQADSRSLNLINEFTSSFATLSIPELHEFPWSLPAEWRKSAEFQLRVTNSLYPKALDIPIFSHGNLQTLNRDDFTLAINYTWAQKVKSLMDTINVSDKMLNFSKGVYFRFMERNRDKASLAIKNKSSADKVEKIIENYLGGDCPEHLRFISPRHYPGHIVGLYRYYLHIRALEKFTK